MAWDNKWTAVSAVAAVAGLLVPLLLFFLGRETKELTVETVSSAILVDLLDPRLSSLKLTYMEVSVSRLTVATIEVRNSGTRPIERADFEVPIVLRFKNPTDVLAVILNEKKTPPDLRPLISSDVSGISIAPLLLNPGDQFQITVQLRGDFNEPTVEARILGVPSISRRMFQESNLTRRGLILMSVGAVLTFIYFYFSVLFMNILRRRQPDTPMSFPERLVVSQALALGGAGLFAAGAISLQLSSTETVSLFSVVIIPSAIMVFLVKRWRRRNIPALEAPPGSG